MKQPTRIEPSDLAAAVGRKVYDHFNPPPDPGIDASYPVITRQDEMAACDINNIVKTYAQTGILPAGQRLPIYADVTSLTDYRQVLDHVRTADKFFQQLPAETRAYFANDAANFLDFVTEPNNRPTLLELGLIREEETPEPPKAKAEKPTA